jgi:hypothetical protein
MDDLKDLEFLAQKSSDFIEKQISTYRQKHTNSASLIAVIALFIPFFLSGLDDSYMLIKIVSLIPVGLLIWAILLFILILRTKPLGQGFHVDKFDQLSNSPYEKILLYEIGANKSSFKDNQKVLDKANSTYNFAVRLTVISIIFSVFILLTNKFFKPEKEIKPIKVELLKTKHMIDDQDNGGSDDSTPKPQRVIPFVPTEDRTTLSEGISNPKANKPLNDSSDE